jgi:hypothetical protein
VVRKNRSGALRKINDKFPRAFARFGYFAGTIRMDRDFLRYVFRHGVQCKVGTGHTIKTS